jgi:hypothetical protein
MPYVQLPFDHFTDDRRIGCTDPEVIATEAVLMVVTKVDESDGRVSALRQRTALAGLGFISDSVDAVKKLVAVGLATEVDDDGTIELTDWDRWMKSKDELDEMRREMARGGRDGGHRSGEVRRAKGTAKGNPSSNGKANPSSVGRVGLQRREGLAEPNPTHPNGSEPNPPITVEAVFDAYTKHRERQGGLVNPVAFRRSLDREWSSWTEDYIEAHPSARIEQVGDALHARKTSASPSSNGHRDPLEATAAAFQARTERYRGRSES